METLNLLEVDTKVPVFWWDMSHLDPVLQLAREALDELRISHPDSPDSNVKAQYMSPWKSHLLNVKMQPLCQEVIRLAKVVSKTHWNTDIEALNLDFMIADCWGVIYESADKTIAHTHFPSDFAAVMYLEADENCAPIVFERQLVVQPKPKTLVMFPGHVLHEVPENHGHRVVVAMNLNKIPSFSNKSA
jgi:hypothetical protein